MRAARNRRTGLLAVAAASSLALVLTACGGSSGGSPAASGSSSSSGASTSSGGGGKASAIGVTGNSITVGNVSVLSGPIPGLFKGAPHAVEAYFAMVNSQGGVDGRQLKLEEGDDGLNCTQNASRVKSFSDSVFALVGSFSTFQGCGIKAIESSGIPDVEAYLLDPRMLDVPTAYFPSPAPPGYVTGKYKYLSQQNPGAIQHIGTVATQLGKVNWEQHAAALESIGGKVLYQRYATTNETSFTSDIVKMRDAGVQWLSEDDVDLPTAVRVLQAAYQQNWHPKIITCAVCYDGNFFTLLGNPAAAQGVTLDLNYAMFLGEDRAQNKGVDNLLTWMKKVHPDDHVDLFAMYGWTAAQLFVDALKQAGPNPTRDSLLTAIKGIHSFDADGILAPADPGAKKPFECWMLGTIKGSKFVRTYPDKGFSCNPGGYYYAKS